MHIQSCPCLKHIVYFFIRKFIYELWLHLNFWKVQGKTLYLEIVRGESSFEICAKPKDLAKHYSLRRESPAFKRRPLNNWQRVSDLACLCNPQFSIAHKKGKWNYTSKSNKEKKLQLPSPQIPVNISKSSTLPSEAVHSPATVYYYMPAGKQKAAVKNKYCFSSV